MKSGVPKSKSSYINSEYSDEALDALYGLPQSWRDFVNACDITETDTKIQSAIWELVTTEVDYIHAIQTVTDVSVDIPTLSVPQRSLARFFLLLLPPFVFDKMCSRRAIDWFTDAHEVSCVRDKGEPFTPAHAMNFTHQPSHLPWLLSNHRRNEASTKH